MNPPSPAIVSQSAMRRLPRWTVLLLCSTYILAGFVGREPWRDADMAAFGYMQAMAAGLTPWLAPLQEGLAPTSPGLLQYWLGAWALQLMPSALPADMVVRLPFMALLALALCGTWWAMHGLARMPGAQPVAFAFGGEASGSDYARTMADAGLLALLACLGLAQMGHETTHTLVQLAAVSGIFFAASSMWWQPRAAAAIAPLSQMALALAGAPAWSVILSLAVVITVLRVRSPRLPQRYSWAAWWVMGMIVAACMAWMLHLWQWKVHNPWTDGRDWQSATRLMLWFAWPAWPLALWTLWRWRQQLLHPWRQLHIAMPLFLCVLAVAATLFTRDYDQALFLGLPGIATLAAFALPTLRRSLGALVDWLTLIFFTISALTMWVVWVSVQTGMPAKPAANVAKLADGFLPHFTPLPFFIAVAGSAAWLLLVAWRTRRHRAALWKSLAVPAGGTTLGWLLLMTLWMPMLDYARSFAPHVRSVMQHVPASANCVQTLGLSAAQISAFKFYTPWQMHHDARAPSAQCSWMVSTPQAWSALDAANAQQWRAVTRVQRPTDRRDFLLVLQRTPS